MKPGGNAAWLASDMAEKRLIQRKSRRNQANQLACERESLRNEMRRNGNVAIRKAGVMAMSYRRL